MISWRTCIGLATAAILLPSATPAAAAAADTGTAVARPGGGAPQTWGPHHSPGKRAKASGTVTATNEDHDVIPAAGTLKVSGKVHDLTRTSSNCGWAVFGIAVVNTAGNKVTWKRHHERTCAYGKPRTFSFTYHRVYQVELKVCAERRASQPSIQCTAGNPAWKTIYLSPH
ncbi:hypothetical protein FE391_35560 [Nonomuraea sp. KC401]|uniref:hypothetical protein n=1 Tax=unclassified Nonomuraea TaxID=2593643 RepID=UPI0010FE45A8|nr:MULTISPECIES: hypothetical protein [unclassified Nonomuraea]NBE99290.1 hypothetical protein [Nonomuraea sp. K271]TLF58980.1 hypothetical protein FE391_35560 [Nonomuraea sp. KC401]